MSTTTPGTTPTVPTTAAEIHAAALARATEACESLNLFNLARMADCGTPAGPGAAGDVTSGADALRTARNVAAEACEWHLAELDLAEAADLCDDAWDLVQAVADSIHEGIDGTAVLTYTARYREAFADLDGWEEDPAGEFGAVDCGMDKLAQLAVFSIMRRCAEAVADQYGQAYAEAVEDLTPEHDTDDTDD